MKKTLLITCLALLPLTINAAEKETPKTQSNFGVTAKIGTLGNGLDLTYRIKPKLNTRLNINGASADHNEVEDGVRYNGKLKLSTVGALLDYHPFENGFRLTGGVYNNKNKISGSSANNNTTVQVGDTDYDISQGVMTSAVSFKSIAPYVGLGWGNAVRGYKNFNVSFDVGLLLQGSPQSKLGGSGTATATSGPNNGSTYNIATDSTFRAELDKEEANLNKELEDFEVFPSISLGVSYNF